MNHSFIKWLVATSICFATGTSLENIQYNVKRNGVVIELDYSEAITDDKIIGWKSNHNWIYFTLLGVKTPRNKMPNNILRNPVTSIVLDDFDESTQLSFMLKKPILGYDIMNVPSLNKSMVFVHTADSQAQADMLQDLKMDPNAPDKRGPKNIGFPEYNREFQAAFDQARAELGANAIFKHKGQLYITNHPGESRGSMVAGLQSKDEDPEDIYIPEVFFKDPELEEKPSFAFDPETSAFYSDDDPEPMSKTAGWVEIKEQESGTLPASPQESYEPLIIDEFPDELESTTISPDWVTFEEPELDEYSIMTPEELKQPPPSVSAEDLGEMPEFYDWIDVKPADQALDEKYQEPEKVYPDKVQVAPYKQKEIPDDVLVQEKWYKLQSRLMSMVPAAVRVTSNIEGVPIYIDGELVGETPLSAPVQISPGWHQVSGFTPIYAMILNRSGMEYITDDPILRNNQMFGSKTVYVDPGNVSVVNFRFNEIGPPTKNLAQTQGGMLIGFPVIMALFGLITWGMI